MENRTKTGVSRPWARNAGAGHRRRRPVGDEDPVGAGAAGVDDALGDALVVEVGDLLAQVMVLQQHRAARTRLQRVVRVGEPHALGRGEVLALLSAMTERRPCRDPGR